MQILVYNKLMANFYIGLSLGPTSTIESGIAVMQKDGSLSYVDKLFSMNDVIYFFDNFHSLKDSVVMVSLPWDNAMLNGKWRVLSKPYQRIHENPLFRNADNWMQRFSPRGCDYLSKLVEKGVDVRRFEVYLTRQKLNLYSNYKERSPADCKFYQSALKLNYGFSSLPNNMMPVAQLEAITGALLAKEFSNGNTVKIFTYNGIDAVNVV